MNNLNKIIFPIACIAGAVAIAVYAPTTQEYQFLSFMLIAASLIYSKM